MSAASRFPTDFSLIFHDSLSDSYELSEVLLATAGFDGTLQLLTSGWERMLGYGREELKGKTLADLLWSDRRSAARVAAEILDPLSMGTVELRVRCRNGVGKSFRLHRRYDEHEQMVYIVAEETADEPTPALLKRAERRAALRAPGA
jgi:PAS domain S-box-containing protein